MAFLYLKKVVFETRKKLYKDGMEKGKWRKAFKESRLFRWIPGLIGLGILITVIVLHGNEGRKLLELVTHINPAWLLLAAFVQLGTYLCSALVWRWTLGRLGTHLPIKALMMLGVKKLFTDQVIPTGGIGGTLLVSRSLLKQKVSAETTTTGVIANFYSYYLAYALSILASLVILWRHHDINPLIQKISFFFFIVVMLILVGAWQLTRSNENRFRSWLEKRASIKQFLDILKKASPKTALKPSILLPNILFQSGVFLCDALSLQVLLAALGQSATFPILFASFMMAYVVETLGPIPGGLGVFESSSVAMLTLGGIPVSTALAATLLLRGFTFWLPMIPGFLLIQRDYRRG